jgi:DNA helicase II / ATP-dependent DNA helicase PcrA
MAKPSLKATKKKAAKPLTAPKPPARRSRQIEATPPIAANKRVTHPTFGPGVVVSVDGDKLEIKFKSVGVKWIVESYVKPV